MRSAFLALFYLASSGCSSDESSAQKAHDGGGGSGGIAIDSASDAPESPPDGTVPTHPSSLPFSYTRPEKGDPVDDAAIGAATDQLIDLLKQTQYFDFIDERVHGWPESD